MTTRDELIKQMALTEFPFVDRADLERIAAAHAAQRNPGEDLLSFLIRVRAVQNQEGQPLSTQEQNWLHDRLAHLLERFGEDYAAAVSHVRKGGSTIVLLPPTSPLEQSGLRPPKATRPNLGATGVVWDLDADPSENG